MHKNSVVVLFNRILFLVLFITAPAFAGGEDNCILILSLYDGSAFSAASGPSEKQRLNDILNADLERGYQTLASRHLPNTPRVFSVDRFPSVRTFTKANDKSTAFPVVLMSFADAIKKFKTDHARAEVNFVPSENPTKYILDFFFKRTVTNSMRIALIGLLYEQGFATTLAMELVPWTLKRMANPAPQLKFLVNKIREGSKANEGEQEQISLLMDSIKGKL